MLAARRHWARLGSLAATAVIIAIAQLAPAVALAGDDAISADEERARQESRELFKQGKNAFKAGDYDAARELFQKAWARYDKEPLIALALAKSCDRANLLEKALIYYEHFLRLAPPDKDYAQDRETTVARVAAIRELLAARPGILRFRGLPTGAELLVDGKPADVDANGQLKVAAGTHNVRVTFEKRLPFERQAIAVGPGETKDVDVVLVAPVDPSTLPRDHKWTWRAGIATSVSLAVAGAVGATYWLKYRDYTSKFNADTGQPTEETQKLYPNKDGSPCRPGRTYKPSGEFECAAAVKAGVELKSSVDRWGVATVATGGVTAILGLATAMAALAAPTLETGAAKPAWRWQVAPQFSADGGGALVQLDF